MVEAACGRGAVALEHYRRGFSVSLKADRSPVTEADRAAEGEIALSTIVKAWDVAALKVVVEEVGGRLTDLDGRPGIYGSTVFKSNGLLHDAALAAVRTGRR